MRFLPLALLLWFGGRPPVELKKIDDLNDCVQTRFQVPNPETFGMSRNVVENSLGQHFTPLRTLRRDFEPENDRERRALDALEKDGAQVGLYLFGKTVESSAPDALNFRALKGPAAITAGTPRPDWYPGLREDRKVSADALPDWKTIYPLARRAMRSFADGGKGFEMSMDSWQIAARPVRAGSTRCLGCHPSAKSGDALGGVIYAYRRPTA